MPSASVRHKASTESELNLGDYCDTFLTHDSPSVRKTHNGGRKHKENVRMYYQAWMEQQAQKLVDATARAFTQQRMLQASQGGPPIPVRNVLRQLRPNR